MQVVNKWIKEHKMAAASEAKEEATADTIKIEKLEPPPAAAKPAPSPLRKPDLKVLNLNTSAEEEEADGAKDARVPKTDSASRFKKKIKFAFKNKSSMRKLKEANGSVKALEHFHGGEREEGRARGGHRGLRAGQGQGEQRSPRKGRAGGGARARPVVAASLLLAKAQSMPTFSSFEEREEVEEQEAQPATPQARLTLRERVAQYSVPTTATTSDTLAAVPVCKSIRFLQKYGCLHHDPVCGKKPK